jgi:hypothetical protein
MMVEAACGFYLFFFWICFIQLVIVPSVGVGGVRIEAFFVWHSMA